MLWKFVIKQLNLLVFERLLWKISSNWSFNRNVGFNHERAHTSEQCFNLCGAISCRHSGGALIEKVEPSRSKSSSSCELCLQFCPHHRNHLPFPHYSIESTSLSKPPGPDVQWPVVCCWYPWHTWNAPMARACTWLVPLTMPRSLWLQNL